MIGQLLPLIIPAIGVFIVVVLQLPTKPGTSTKPEGDDHHQDRRTP